MSWDDPPPNPLQHVKPALTKSTYAEKGAEDADAAMNRCLLRKETRNEAIDILKRRNVNVKQLCENRGIEL